jgi:hypothetical protein
MGLIIFPSNIPNPYQSRFRGESKCGDKRVTATNKIALTRAAGAIVPHPLQCAYAATAEKTAVKNQPNLRLVGKFRALEARELVINLKIVFSY